MNLRTRIIYDGDTIVDTIQKNITWSKLRDERDGELDRTDWRFMSDQTPSQEWIDYRQFLRDLPQNYFDEYDEVSQGANAAADAWNEYNIPE